MDIPKATEDNIVTKDNFEQEVLKSDKPVLLEFFASWCGPCKVMAPTLDKVAAEKADTVKVLKVDVDASPELVKQYFIRTKPTMFIIRDGKAISKKTGVRTKANLGEWIDDVLKLPADTEIDLAKKHVSLSEADEKTLRKVFESVAKSLPEAERKAVERGLNSGRTFREMEDALNSGNKDTLNDVIHDIQRNGFGLPKPSRP